MNCMAEADTISERFFRTENTERSERSLVTLQIINRLKPLILLDFKHFFLVFVFVFVSFLLVLVTIIIVLRRRTKQGAAPRPYRVIKFPPSIKSYCSQPSNASTVPVL